MLEVIRSQNQAHGFNRISQPACEVSQFMKNFFEAVQEGNSGEISSYYADEIEPFDLPANAEFSDETIAVDDHLATFSCSLGDDERSGQRLICVLDKSEGYWQIIHGEIKNETQPH